MVVPSLVGRNGRGQEARLAATSEAIGFEAEDRPYQGLGRYDRLIGFGRFGIDHG